MTALHSRTPMCWGCISGGQASQALGRSRGGFSIKIHNRQSLTFYQRVNDTCAEALIDYNSEYVIADTSYDSMALIESITQRGAVPVIPPRANRRDSRTYDVHCMAFSRMFYQQNEAVYLLSV